MWGNTGNELNGVITHWIFKQKWLFNEKTIINKPEYIDIDTRSWEPLEAKPLYEGIILPKLASAVVIFDSLAADNETINHVIFIKSGRLSALLHLFS